jgi:hypothetical protein
MACHGVRWICLPVLFLCCAAPIATGQTAPPADFPSLDLQPFSDRLGGAVEKSGRALPPADEGVPPLDDRVPVGGRTGDERPGELPFPEGSGIDWGVQRVSPADLVPADLWAFEHGQPRMTESESGFYGELIRSALNRRNLIPASLPEGMNATTAWETAFYQFESVRRQAFGRGVLQLESGIAGIPDPLTGGGVFEGSGPPGGKPGDKGSPEYSLLTDMRSHPGEFVGRPVVMYGIFSPSGPLEVNAAGGLEGEAREYLLQRGTLKSLTGRELLAIVDALQFVEPGQTQRPSSAWPVDRGVEIPVLVKGWFVKLWGQQPLIFTELVRVLSPRPYAAWIREHVANRRRVGTDESWLYYETLRQLQVTSVGLQRQLALSEQQQRVDQLLSEIRQKAAADRASLADQLRRGVLAREDMSGEAVYESRIRRLERQLSLREVRYEKALRQPESFPIFVDMFQNPDRWQGKLVTLRGYVRRVLTHPGDALLFGGQPLHELWLYTRDSQHIPAVVVTPSLPRDFPKSADLIDSVIVTGCFYRMYVYRAQEETRQAPLLLAGRIDWQPSPQHVLGLVRDGLIPEDAGIAVEARAKDPRRVSDTVVLGIAVLVLVIAMTIFGRVQRDRRRRERLMRLVEERPDFRQTPVGVSDSLP